MADDKKADDPALARDEIETLKLIAHTFSKEEIETFKVIVRTFSREDIETVKLMAKYWAGFNTVSKGLGGLGRFGQWALYVYALYVAVKLGVLDQWIVGKPPK